LEDYWEEFFVYIGIDFGFCQDFGVMEKKEGRRIFNP
jgi:hypothetical protein